MNVVSDGTGLRFYPDYLDRERQAAVLAELRKVLAAAPLFTSRMPRSGQPMSVRMSNCGSLGWLSDQGGYRYEPKHPETGQPWPPIPEALVGLWNEVAQYPQAPEACLVNFLCRDRQNGPASGSR